VDGPEFDGHQVNFDELTDRLASYREFEHTSLRHANENCLLHSKTSHSECRKK
jgi:ferredoxin--NADP+ reductase